jgi:glucose/arabinose dehydrogenase
MAALRSLLAVAFVACSVSAQNTTTQAAAYPTSTACASTIAPRHGQPSVAPGWLVQVVASGLTKPRGIVFDSEGNLLVVQQGYGISRLNLTSDAGACVRAQGNATDIIVNKEVSVAANEVP